MLHYFTVRKEEKSKNSSHATKRYLLLESVTDILEYVVNLRQLILMRLGVACLVKYLLRFLSEHVDLALTCRYHRLDVLCVDVVYVGDAVVPVLADRTPEAHTDLAIATVTLDIFTCMLAASFVAAALSSGLHNEVA